MPNVLVNDEYLSDIADAIRAKNGSSDTYTPGQMAGAIEDIEGGGGSTLITKSITENGTCDATDDSADGYSEVTVNVTGRRLPDAYTEVEYLSVSTSGPYINTGVLNGSQSYFELDAKYDSSPSSNSGLFGCMYGSEFVVNTYRDVFYANCGDGRAVVPSGSHQLRHKFVANANGIYIDECLMHSANWNNHCDKPYYLFAFYYDDNTTYKASYARVYSCKIYNGSDLVRDFVPCCRNSDNEPGMYDLVNGVFYDNDGTGSFSVGANVVLPANARLISKTVTANGTYDASDDDADGYSSVNVNVVGGSSPQSEAYVITPGTNITLPDGNRVFTYGPVAAYSGRIDKTNGSGSMLTGEVLFTVPQEVAPYRTIQQYVSNGGQYNSTNLPNRVIINTLGQCKLDTDNVHSSYIYASMRWFINPDRAIPITTYDTNYISSIEGPILIYGKTFYIDSQITFASTLSDGWANNIITLPLNSDDIYDISGILVAENDFKTYTGNSTLRRRTLDTVRVNKTNINIYTVSSAANKIFVLQGSGLLN